MYINCLWNDHHTRRSIAKQTARPFAWLPVAVVERGVLSILLCFVQASTKRFTSRCRQFTLDRNCQTVMFQRIFILTSCLFSNFKSASLPTSIWVHSSSVSMPVI
ncbi:6-dideoxy-alpha-D-galactopyranose transaminase,dTDP-3-amino-3 [Trichinella spiralis]|uniref:6-dideoxy-alpha-D-galactopyranose transaminase,dTDP-3-amino-3 n=1 Tax=Trichinella spiralis TaxID=6334 RepID=A0ABR3K1J7_TRISP